MSEAVKMLHTMKPKIPENLKILTDYEKRKFRYYLSFVSFTVFQVIFVLLTRNSNKRSKLLSH